jgi:hypothetical protein
MSIYWSSPAFAADPTAAGTHVFVVGAGAYPHLAAGALAARGVPLALGQLTSPPVSAKAFARWFEQTLVNPAAPLATIELLLSPAESLTNRDGTLVPIEEAAHDNIARAFTRWDARCNANAQNVAIFYFCGHGLAREDLLLLAADFGDPAFGNLWRNAIDLNATHTSMAACAARTQLYFIDACRETPIALLHEINISATNLKNGQFGPVGRDAPIYFAAGEGLRGFGLANDVSFFTAAVIAALDGVGAADQGAGWQVNTSTLGPSVAFLVRRQARKLGIPLASRIGGEGGATTIHLPPRGIVRTAIGCLPPAALSAACIDILLGAVPIHQRPVPAPEPYEVDVSPGIYDLRARFPGGQFGDAVRAGVLMTPPGFEWDFPL